MIELGFKRMQQLHIQYGEENVFFVYIAFENRILRPSYASLRDLLEDMQRHWKGGQRLGIHSRLISQLYLLN